MINFDISNSKYVTTTSKEPYKYYLEIAEKYLSQPYEITGGKNNPEIQKDIERTLKEAHIFLNKELQDTGGISSPKSLHRLCYYAFAKVLFDASFNAHFPNRLYALEMYYLPESEDDTLILNEKGFYSKIQSITKEVLYDGATRALLTSKNRWGENYIIDFDLLSMNLRQAINGYSYKMEKIDPRLAQSGLPNKEFHQAVRNVIDDFCNDIIHIVENYSPSTYSL